jgi:hypothetical protein
MFQPIQDGHVDLVGFESSRLLIKNLRVDQKFDQKKKIPLVQFADTDARKSNLKMRGFLLKLGRQKECVLAFTNANIRIKL